MLQYERKKEHKVQVKWKNVATQNKGPIIRKEEERKQQ